MFAENDRISHRQLLRQIVLALLAPFLLCLPGWRNLRGLNGILGAAAVFVLLGFYVIFLVRLAPAYEHLIKTMGKVQGVGIVVLYLVYLLFTAAYLLDLLVKLAAKWLLPDVPVLLLRVGILVVCVLGSHRGLQKRARMAEVSYVLVVGGIALLAILAAMQLSWDSVGEVLKENIDFYKSKEAFYGLCGGFSALTLLPFLLSKVEKSASAGKAVYGAVGILLVFLAAVFLIVPMAIGWNRMLVEQTPLLPLLAGTNLPGDLLARFDAIWLILLFYAMLFSLGSLFYYGSHMLQQVNLPVSHWILALIVGLISGNPFAEYRIAQYYEVLLRWVFTPLLFFLTFYVYLWYRRKKI